MKLFIDALGNFFALFLVVSTAGTIYLFQEGGTCTQEAWTCVMQVASDNLILTIITIPCLALTAFYSYFIFIKKPATTETQ